MGTNKKRGNQQKAISIKNIYRKIVAAQLVLMITLALFLGISGTLINLHYEVKKRDQNLQNIAEAIANSPLVDDKIENVHQRPKAQPVDSRNNRPDNGRIIASEDHSDHNDHRPDIQIADGP